MKKIDISKILGIFANIGIIAGILFLAIELRQNNNLLAAQASYAQFNIERERRSRMIENTDGLADLFMRRNSTNLNRVEVFRLEQHWRDVIDSWEWQFREYRAGRLQADMVNIEDWRGQWNISREMRELYESTLHHRDADFLEFMQENVINQ